MPSDVDILIAIRKALGYSWQQFAEELGYTNIYSYRSIENGEKAVNPKLKNRLIKQFHVNSLFMNSGEGEIFTGGNSTINNSSIASEPMPPSYSNASISSLIEQNHQLVKQVSDLIKMQMINAQTINNLSKLGIEHQQREMNSS